MAEDRRTNRFRVAAWASAAMLAAPLVLCLVSRAPGQSGPGGRQEVGRSVLRQWSFEKDADGWRADHDCSLSVRDGRLKIVSTGEDPYLHCPIAPVTGSVELRLRGRGRTGGSGQVFWMTDRRPQCREGNSVRFDLIHDGQWHDYVVRVDAKGRLTGLRLDPGSGGGEMEIDRMTLSRFALHPLEIAGVRVDGGVAHVTIRNHDGRTRVCAVGGREVAIEAGTSADAEVRLAGGAAFETAVLTVAGEGLPELKRTIHVYHPTGQARWLACGSDKLTVKTADDGSGAVVEREGKAVAVLCPLVSVEGTAVPLKIARKGASAVSLAGEGLSLEMAVDGEEIAVVLRADRRVEGPAVRVLGPLEEGVFAGLEYLGKGERSSSTLDIETADHLRYAPDVLKVTMPLMACATGGCLAAVTWKDMSLQPVFACPNVFDGTADQRMALRGREIRAAIRIAPPARVTDAVLWAVRKAGLPPLPASSRSAAGQRALCLKAIDGPLKGPDGWSHCIGWKSAPAADFASTIYRLTGKAPEMGELTPGGSHIRNDAIYFVTGRAEQWLAGRRSGRG